MIFFVKVFIFVFIYIQLDIKKIVIQKHTESI